MRICSTCAEATSRAELAAFAPDLTVVTTAPELSVLALRAAGAARAAALVARHRRRRRPDRRGRPARLDDAARGPAQAGRRRRGDGRVRGDRGRASPAAPGTDSPGLAYRDGGAIRVNGGPQAAPLHRRCRRWLGPTSGSPATTIIITASMPQPGGPGAEVEASRGCPYSCTFCAKENFRDSYRRRAARTGDGRDRRACSARASTTSISSTRSSCPTGRCSRRWSGRGLKFGVQTRIDLWKPEMLELLGRAGCVSIEAGVESLTPEGRDAAGQGLQAGDRRAGRPADRRQRHVPFVQANLLEMPQDDTHVWRVAICLFFLQPRLQA